MAKDSKIKVEVSMRNSTVERLRRLAFELRVPFSYLVEESVFSTDFETMDRDALLSKHGRRRRQ